MFSKTPKELIAKDFSNIYNKCQSAYELVSNRKFDVSLALLTTAEAYAIAEKAYVRCDVFTDLQTQEVEDFVNAFDVFYFELKQVLFHEDDDFDSLYKRLRKMSDCYEKVNSSFDLI